MQPSSTTVKGIDKYSEVSYYITMINAIKNKYETYTPGEFLPIFYEGELANRREFHMYKLKKAAVAADNAWMGFVNRAHSK